MTFFPIRNPKKEMLKHDIFGVKQAKKHASADGLIFFGFKMDL